MTRPLRHQMSPKRLPETPAGASAPRCSRYACAGLHCRQRLEITCCRVGPITLIDQIRPVSRTRRGLKADERNPIIGKMFAGSLSGQMPLGQSSSVLAGVEQFRIGMRPNRPADGQAIEASPLRASTSNVFSRLVRSCRSAPRFFYFIRSSRNRARVADAGCHAAALRVVAPALPALMPAAS
jgi:hypothetical protein